MICIKDVIKHVILHTFLSSKTFIYCTETLWKYKELDRFLDTNIFLNKYNLVIILKNDLHIDKIINI